MASRTFLPFTLLILALPGLALAQGGFRVEVTEVVGDRDVTLNATSVGNQVATRIQNNEPTEVTCEVTFRTGPDRRTRRVTIEGGQTGTAVYTVMRSSTQRVRVSALCQ